MCQMMNKIECLSRPSEYLRTELNGVKYTNHSECNIPIIWKNKVFNLSMLCDMIIEQARLVRLCVRAKLH